ncbi:MAG: hypothetical protein RLZZ292_3154 [Bacteroidota bacterium]
MPFAPVGAKWTSGGIYTVPPWGTPTVEMDVCTKDTIIEGKKCSEIQLDQHYYICHLLANDKLYMYKEDGKIYAWVSDKAGQNPPKFFLLYDFSNPVVGHSWQIEAQTYWNPATCKIKAIDTLNTFIGKKIRRFSIELRTMRLPDTVIIKRNFIWYEHIGIDDGFVPPLEPSKLLCDNFSYYKGRLRCYEDKNKGFTQFYAQACDDVSEPPYRLPATWTYSYKHILGDTFSLYKTYWEKDTMVQGKNCSKIKIGYNTCYPYGKTVYLTMEKNKVSLWNEGQFSLLYDYTAKVGQSWDFTYTATQNGEKKTETIRMVLDSMRWANPTSPLISQHRIRYISLQRAINGIYQTYHHDRLIDDIGFNSHLLPKSNLFSCSDTKGAIENLLCFDSFSLLNEEPYTQRFTKRDCKNIDAVTDNSSIYDLHVFPNPAQEEITIASEGIGFEKGDFKIFDLSGQNVYAQLLNQNETQQQFNVDGLKNGFYVYEIRFGKYSAKKGKLLIVK